MTDIDKAAERVRRLRHYVDASLREKLVAPMVLDLRDVLTSYAAQAAEIAELRAKLEAAEKERDHDRLFTRTVLSSLHWTGDGYEWTGGRFDYRMSPSEAASLTTSDIESLSHKNLQLKAELTALRTAAASFEDSRPVDEAWCRELGATIHGDGLLRHAEWKPQDWYHIRYWFEVREVSIHSGGASCILRKKVVRGQLNHLLAALRPGGA